MGQIGLRVSRSMEMLTSKEQGHLLRTALRLTAKQRVHKPERE